MKAFLLGVAVAAGLAAAPASARFERDAFTPGFDYDYPGFTIDYYCCFSANDVISFACCIDSSCTGSFANAVFILNRSGFKVRKGGGFN